VRIVVVIIDCVSAIKQTTNFNTCREVERKEMADIIEQDKLVEVKGKKTFV
jgi:nucleosome binding factor SPN SPT16 subunit